MDIRPLSNKEKYAQLGLNHSTAKGKLRKVIIFDMLQKQRLNRCFFCKEVIKEVDDLSIEHKHPWMNTEKPSERYFDVGNIIYVHTACNRLRGSLSSDMIEALEKEKEPVQKSSTGFRYVHAHSNPNRPYRVRIREDGKMKSFGTFATVLEAVMEADKQILRIQGDSAMTNKKLGLIHY